MQNGKNICSNDFLLAVNGFCKKKQLFKKFKKLLIFGGYQFFETVFQS